MMSEEKAFLGRGWSFPPTFSRGSSSINVKMVAGEEDIHESIRIILFTRLGGRLFHPEFGAGLDREVFKPANETTRSSLKNLVSKALFKSEHRITVESIDVEFEKEVAKIKIRYRVIITNSRTNIVYPFYYTRDKNFIGKGEVELS